MKVDPVCGMEVDDDASIRSTYRGDAYVFCAKGCKEAFDANPENYLVENDSPNSPEWSRYTPLFVIVTVSVLAALAKQIDYAAAWNGRRWMHDFMGYFLVAFAMVKLFDLKAFAAGFAKYDLLAAISRHYAMAYPFLELVLGLGYLSMWQPTVVYVATIVLLGFGSLGVLNAMRQGKKLTCACMGETLNVPLSNVTLTEDLGMAAMAAAMLFSG